MTRLGTQIPRLYHVPKYEHREMGLLAVELAEKCGIMLDPWQKLVLAESLGMKDGQYSAFEVGLVVPRQNGKGEILMVRELAGLFLFEEELILHSAHDFKTSTEAFLRIRAVVDNNFYLRTRMKKVRTSHGEEGLELKNGCRLRFVARSRGSGRGFTTHAVILDEAFNLNAEKVAAILPTLSATPNPQLWYASSAGLEDSEQLREIRRRATVDDASERKDLAYFEWSVPEDSNLDDRDAWANANPALGYRSLNERFVSRERHAMGDDEFGRERLGIWAIPSGVTGIDFDRWKSLADAHSAVQAPFSYGVDVAPDRTHAALGVCSGRGNGIYDIEVMSEAVGTSWVIPRLVEICKKNRPLFVILDPYGPAVAIRADVEAALEEIGIELICVTQADAAEACELFSNYIDNRKLRHRDQPVLNVALTDAKRKAVGDGKWIWARKHTRGSIAPLVTVGLALYGLVAKQETPEEEPTLLSAVV